MTERQIIERLMLKIEETRKAQDSYFKNRTDTDKRLSMAKEAHLDAYVKELRKRGYHPESANDNSHQQKLL